MPEWRRRTLLVVLAAAVLVTVVGAVVLLERRRDEAFGHGRHDEDEWYLVFDERFEGTVLDTEWWNTCHWWDEGGCTIESNDELQWYLPSQVEVGDGRLRLTAEEVPTEGLDDVVFPYRSGMVTTGPPEYQAPAKFDFTYGRVEARVRVPAGQGLWSAIWLLPSSSESRPEIDVLESLGDDPSEWIFHFHPADESRDSDGHRIRGPDLSEGWHDVGLDWEPGRLRWFIDGREVWSVEGERVPDEPMYLVANLAVGGQYPGPPDEGTKFPTTFEIERVTVWQRPT